MTPRPQNITSDAEEVRRAERAAASLSALEREVLVLSAGHGLRIEEIAARLGLGQSRTERLLARALRKFDRALNDRPASWSRLWRR